MTCLTWNLLKNAWPLLLAGLLLTSCAAPDGRALEDVGRRVEARTGKALGSPAAAAPLLAQPLTADSAARVALLGNRAFLARLEDVGIAQADLVEAGLLENPRLFGSARFPDRAPRAANLEAGLGGNVLDLLTRPLRRRVAAAELEKTKLEVAHDAIALVAETKEAVYALQAREQLLERLELAAKAGQAALEVSAELRKAGNITELDLANQQAAYDETRLELDEVRTEITAHREKLNRLLGTQDWRVRDGLPELPGSDPAEARLEALALDQRYDLLAGRLELEALARALKLTHTYRFLGTLEVGVSAERESEGTNLAGPELTVELPIFHQGQARIAKLEAQLRQAERRFEGAALDARSEVREARAELAAGRRRVGYYAGSVLPNRAKIVKESLLQYNAMQIGPAELLLARESQLKAERGYAEALEGYWTARARLEAAVGGNLDGEERSK
jgi:cobalt-zinc-cadmium efflux system outer membrane protein